MSDIFPLSPLEQTAKTHAILCSIGFLILLPIGVLVARFSRTFTPRWFYAHGLIQLVISGPIIWAGWNFGHKTASELQLEHYHTHHGKIGLALLILYVIQVSWGIVIHFFKTPSLFGGYRPPQNYFHIGLGVIILAMANYQVYYGLHTEWQDATGGLHVVPRSAKDAWIALVVIFWALVVLGYGLLPRQFAQEKEAREKA